MLQQFQQMKSQFERVKSEAGAKYFEAEAGEERVKVRISGLGVVDSVKIAPELLQAADPLVVEGLIQAAVNDAIEKVKDNLKGEVSKATSDLNLPGL